MVLGKKRLDNYHFTLFILTLLTVIAGCGRHPEEKRYIPDEVLKKEFGIAAVPADTETSLMNLRPPIDDNNTPYLFPHEHPDLPKNIADWLSERGYVIPQNIPKDDWDKYFPINVITGEFTKKGRKDLAVYCTNRETTAIVIFKGGNVDDVEIFDKYLRPNDQNQPKAIPIRCCIYCIYKISPEDIFTVYLQMRIYGAVQPPPLYNDGIVSTVIMGYGIIYYKFEDQWYSLKASE